MCISPRFSLIVVLTVVLAAPAAWAGEPVELRLWRVPDKTSENPIERANRLVYDTFCMRNPRIRVKPLVPLKIEGPISEGNEFLAIAGGSAPDVFSLWDRQLGNYYSQGFLMPLNKYISDYAGSTGRPYEGVSAPWQVWVPCHDQGKILAVPYTYVSTALFCSSSAFAKAGLSGRYPRDWNELYWFARKLTYDPTKEPNAKPDARTQYGYRLVVVTLNSGWHYSQWVQAGGGDVLGSYLNCRNKLYPVPLAPIDFRGLGIKIGNEDQYARELSRRRQYLSERGLPTTYGVNDLQWKLETNSPESMRAFKFYQKMIHQPWMRNRGHEFDITAQMLKSGRAVDPVTGETFSLKDKAVRKRIYHGVTMAVEEQSGSKLENITFAMWFGDLKEIAEAQDLRSDIIVPFPPYPGLSPAPLVHGHYLGINNAIAAEDKPGRRDAEAIRKAAWQYILFYTGAQAQKIRAKSLVNAGFGEYVRPSLLEAAGYEDELARIPKARRKLWDDLERYAKTQPYTSGYQHILTRELGMAIEALVVGKPDPGTGEFSVDIAKVMDETANTANTMILGKMPQAEVDRRSRAGWIIFALIALALAVATREIIRLSMRAQAKGSDIEGYGVGGSAVRRRIYAWVFLLPAVGTIAVWSYYPLLQGLFMGFQDYRILGGSEYVGLRNFIEAVCDVKFWRYLLQTLQYTVMLVGLGFLAPIVLALLLHEIPKGKVLYRTIYYLPAVTTGLVTLFLWKGLMYDPSNQGVINQLILWFNTWPPGLAGLARIAALAAVVAVVCAAVAHSLRSVDSWKLRLISGAIGFGGAAALVYWIGGLVSGEGLVAAVSSIYTRFDLPAQSFLRDAKLAMLWLVVPVIWGSAGPGCLIYLAALKGIPEEQYEAADLDGAGLWPKIVNVTYPNLKALIIINLVGAVIGAFKESSQIFVMTGGGPQDATMTTGLYIWVNAFMFLNFGLSTAMAWVMGALLIGFTLKQLQILNKLQFRSAAVDTEAQGGQA